MQVLIVRHASAGPRSTWGGPDCGRPLDEVGRRQAERLGVVLGTPAPRQILTSPFVRCRQTVAPLARRSGVVAVPVAWLAPGAVADAVADILAGLVASAATDGDRPGGTIVLCTHREVLAGLLPLVVPGAPAGPWPSSPGPVEQPADKGGTWALTWRAGQVVGVRYHPPPPLTASWAAGAGMR